MASSRVANQRQWDSHITHTRTNDRWSSLTSAPMQRDGSSVLGMLSGRAGPHTEHAQPATATARSSSRTSKRLEFFVHSTRHLICLIFVSCVSSPSSLEGVEVCLGLSDRDNLALEVNIICGPLGGQRSWDP